MPLMIRSASLNDVPALLALEQSAATAAHWTREQYLARVDSGIVLIAEEGVGKISGFVCARIIAGDCELENIVVDENFRRRGIGAALLRELLDNSERNGGSAVWLEVRESNKAARRLYEKQGFRESGRRRHYYKNPEEDAILYDHRPLK
jgi:[ribosomal protein S18]-alanine N-acetyltransferase